MSSINCKCLTSDDDEQPNRAPITEEKKEEIVAKQLLELISCGCNNLVCKDSCSKKPCSEKRQFKGEECSGLKSTVAAVIDEDGAGPSAVLGDETEAVEIPQVKKSSLLTESYEVVSKPIEDKLEAIPLNEDSTAPVDVVSKPTEVSCKDDTSESVIVSCTDQASLQKPVDVTCGDDLISESILPEDFTKPVEESCADDIKSESILQEESTKPVEVPYTEELKSKSILREDSTKPAKELQESTKPLLKTCKEQSIETDSTKSGKESSLISEGVGSTVLNIEDCQCLLEPKPRRISKIPRRISCRPNLERQEASVETDARKMVSVLKKDTDDCICIEPEERLMPRVQEVKTFTSPIQIAEKAKVSVKPAGMKSKTKAKKQSCGCNKTECKDTCKYKPCKGGTCGCNREVCKDSCKRKPCVKSIETAVEDLEAESLVDDGEEIIIVADKGEITDEVYVCKPEPRVKEEIITEGPCGCAQKICKPTCSKKPCNPPDSKDAACGCNEDVCKETCSKKPCNKENPTFNGFPKYVKNLIGEISCLCKKPDLVPKFTKNESRICPTISTLKLGLDSLREKCNNKDIIIDSLRQELQNHTGSNVFSDMLNRIANPSGKKRDYDRYMVVQELPVSECFKVPKLCDCTQGKMEGFSKTDPSPLQIVDVKMITGRCVLVKWVASESREVIGYEIYVRGAVVTRVLNRERTSTVLKWDKGECTGVGIKIYAFTEEGRCFPPATADYKSALGCEGNTDE